MIRALNSAASGMGAQSFRIDVIANNLANAGTTAFKRSRTNTEDLFYQYYKLPGQIDATAQPTTTGTHVGLGTRVQGTQLDMRQGSLLETGQQFDLAIAGDGFFTINDNGRFLFTRAGNFSVNANGQLVLASADRGRLLEPAINIPPDATAVAISPDGAVSIMQAGSNQLNNIGQIQLVRFQNPAGLIQLGENLYLDGPAVGQVLTANPGQDGMGALRQNFLEASNTEPVRELVDLIHTQRNFELNSQVVQAADQGLQLIANLRRF
jgi:flagellar basal-body rod protein FlgG